MGLGSIVSDTILYIFDHPYILAVGCLLYVFVFVLSVLMSGPKPGKNPFTKDVRRPTQPVEIRQQERDKVIKQGIHLDLRKICKVLLEHSCHPWTCWYIVTGFLHLKST